MAHYLCPHCEDVVDFDGRSRVIWCNGCGQPLSMFDLLPLRPAITGENSESPDPASGFTVPARPAITGERTESQEEAPPALA